MTTDVTRRDLLKAQAVAVAANGNLVAQWGFSPYADDGGSVK